MKKLTCSALALTMTCAAGFASDGEWSALDQEVGALASTLTLDGGPTVSGDFRSGYTSSSDFDVFATGADVDDFPDTGGFSVDQARVAVSGSNGDYGYRIDIDFANNDNAGLRDAYATFSMTDSVSAQMGQFRASVCNDADKDENEMDHFYHSAVGAAYSGFTSGLGLSGSASEISWALSIMNGADGTDDENSLIMRASMDLMDGGDDGIDVSASIAIVDEGDDGDDLTEDGGGTIIEVTATNGTWAVGVETMDTDDGGAGAYAGNHIAANTTIFDGTLEGDTGPMAISLSYNIDANWSVALRSTDYDDLLEVSSTEITATNTVSAGVRWQIGTISVESDNDDFDLDDASVLQVGLGISF